MKPKTSCQGNMHFQIIFSILLIILLCLAIIMGNQFRNNSKINYSQQMNESFINGTQAGYIKGIYATSNIVLEQGILPVFDNEGNIQYINLTKFEGGK